ncbi:HlyD family type I secretion periplasmic adaptor subunit [Maridesulfovibrio salexigens]|uniref:Secretion protein HlyD family protein n=1 Tax=Maridesulfovibrio salexigens (strain ATCC 14822 / DSM 2638 / NCIMB 8403 / VKM B-1763) TaxID=526222 RepID=C6BWJ0_MARSD|nr:HlyD family type I secretion periplasmic adaptor subunit [Maridesulfovibrio salexigens]ACS80270.1 secretion protein HlyD family protein [Maridesulfovibrio salexigens DSM 2638]
MGKNWKSNLLWSLEKSLGNCIVLLLILGFTIVFMLWAHSSKIEKTVRAQGVVETNLTDKIVGHFEGGVVEKVFVEEGDTVRKGQEIVAIANTNITEKRNKSLIKMKRLQAKLNRLMAESNNNTDEFSHKASTPEERSEIQFARIRGDALKEKINILKTQIQQSRAALSASEKHVQNLLDEQKVLKEQHDMLEPMVKKGIGSRQLLLQRKTELAKITTNIAEIYNKRDEYSLEIRELEQRINQEELDFYRDIREEINLVSSELKGVREELNAANEQIVRSVIRSPIDGTIYKLSANTVGGIVRSGEALAEIVPLDATIRIEGKVQPSDRTKIWNGMTAKIRPSSYEFSDQTMLKAKIVNISAKTYFDDLTRTWYYRVIFNTIKEDAEKVKEFLPGMIVEVNILSGEESVLEYLLSPITRGMRGALSEHRTR